MPKQIFKIMDRSLIKFFLAAVLALSGFAYAGFEGAFSENAVEAGTPVVQEEGATVEE